MYTSLHRVVLVVVVVAVVVLVAVDSIATATLVSFLLLLAGSRVLNLFLLGDGL